MSFLKFRESQKRGSQKLCSDYYDQDGEIRRLSDGRRDAGLTNWRGREKHFIEHFSKTGATRDNKNKAIREVESGLTEVAPSRHDDGRNGPLSGYATQWEQRWPQETQKQGPELRRKELKNGRSEYSLKAGA
ncbi:hypothetical protein F2Q69_00003774 [Brassica cretica]|uniref:Uncharacterized protein n=1 Tax=Brassica cretica TaxID=69181 RepID=A0A8S9PAI2_BRACR|nr:hypothetical protein F2Q69_00003774 [Brassica cretica]